MRFILGFLFIFLIGAGSFAGGTWYFSSKIESNNQDSFELMHHFLYELVYNDLPKNHNTSCSRPSSQLLSKEKPTQIVFQAVGDLLMHTPIQRNSFARGGYSSLFQPVKHDFEQADLSLANLECPIYAQKPISGFPLFNSRPELIPALKELGIDVLGFANNHSYDQSVQGILNTLNLCDEYGIPVIGMRKYPTYKNMYTILPVNTIKIGLIGYSMLMNDVPMPTGEDLPYMRYIPASQLNAPDSFNEIEDLHKAADFVIVSIHWGAEYVSYPSQLQRKTAHILMDKGADLVIGHHPHVLQPIESYKTQDGRDAMVVYSLGNFVSNQNAGITYANREDPRALRGDSVIFQAVIEKIKDTTYLKTATVIPLWMEHYYDPIEKRSIKQVVNIKRKLLELQLKQNHAAYLDLARLLRHRFEKIKSLFMEPVEKHNLNQFNPAEMAELDLNVPMLQTKDL